MREQGADVQLLAGAYMQCAAVCAAELERRCTGRVGAGEALSGAVVRERHEMEEVTATFAALIRGAVKSAD